MYIVERRARILLLFVFAVALALRLAYIGFGLPSLYDPDEPLFMVKAAQLIADRTLNPRWFGHPGSTTIYLTALIQIATFLVGFLAGSFRSVGDFISAAYADPTIAFLPVRVVMALIGAACAALTFAIAKRLFGLTVAVLSGLFVALNSLHMAWSQVIRTDNQASFFMLLVIFVAMRLVKSGRRRDALFSGLLTGAAIATKWPAATVFVAVIGACLLLVRTGRLSVRQGAAYVGIAAGGTLAGLFLCSPFLLFDYQIVVANLSNEARPQHLGHTGTGFVGNLWTYVSVYAEQAMGWLGLGLALIGLLVASGNRVARYVVLPAFGLFMIGISAQSLIWSRWLVPGIPYLAIFAAVGIQRLALTTGQVLKIRAPAAIALLSLIGLAQSAVSAVGQIRERATDTRTLAARWLTAHARPGSSVVLEHMELGLRDKPFRFLFPVGSAGCRDARSLLRGEVNYDQVEKARAESPIVDLGSIPAPVSQSCRADYAILTYYDLYVEEANRFPGALRSYRTILSGGRTVALFRPVRGKVGGPIVRIVAVPTQQ
ncbi:ArnT family glycosyltransferase [Sphingomonas sp. LHG3443-2]|uniref:ArnT family glycosyltransferase n=1 Tax=Sphingomonas sp. LHG3443-2 TaxID=2804639 RepID=UPI003CF77823